jgi:hypothetical protein
MNINLVTKEDLTEFKKEMLAGIKEILQSTPNKVKQKWMKSFEVREMLGISPGTLQNMRINGTLQFTKVGGLIFYLYDDVIKLLEGNKQNVPWRK